MKMKIERYKDFVTDDFVLDSLFVKWVLNPGKETDEFWTGFLLKYPEKRANVEEAAFMVRSFHAVEDEIPAGRLEAIFDRIVNPAAKRKNDRLLVTVMKIAALFVLLTGISFLLYHLNQPGPRFMADGTMDPADAGMGRVIMADGTVYGFETSETTITQTNAGKILVNQDTITSASPAPKRDVNAMNHIVIPYGIRSQITLSDGTRIWLNSGSQIAYSDNFSNKREVHISGEAFFDVANNNDRPFYVVTKDFRIRVLGTRFNVTAYKDDRTTQTALMSGRVTVGRNSGFSRQIEILPGEKIVFDREEGSFSREDADLQYINSWVHGYLIFRNEPITGIFKRLERYYNEPIIVEGNLEEYTFSGKLDLRENSEEVLENIAFASSLIITYKNNYILVKQNAYEDR
jgi:transmembrane sensor